jgi:hypothetical protein
MMPRSKVQRMTGTAAALLRDPKRADLALAAS